MAAVKKLYDIEVFRNFFQIGLEDYDTREVVNFIISEYQDDRYAIYNFFTSYTGFLISVNGIHYDNMVVNYFIECARKFKDLPALELCSKLKDFSDRIIHNDNTTRTFKKYDPQWIDVDLYLYWSMMLRKSKKISLKSLAIQLNHDEIQELPFHPDTILEYDEQQEIIRYNNRNDLGILRKLWDRQIEEVRLRRFIKYEYKLECWSFDAPKIASELLLEDFVTGTNLTKKEVRAYEHGEYYGTIGDLIKDIPFNFKNKKLEDVYQEILKGRRSFDKTFVFSDKKSGTNFKVSLGIGGIHTLIENKKFVERPGFKLVSSDVRSLYPNLIANYAICRYPRVLQRYKQVINERVEAKRNKLKEKDTLLKLILNSYSGLIDNVYNWLYFPEGALKLRMLGQLLELKALDEASNAGFEVIALNTDSIDCIVPENRLEEYYQIIDKLGEEYNLVFEHELIEWTNFVNINNYIQKSKEGKIKRKGLFRHSSDIPLGDSVNEQVIPKALELYFDKKIAVSESISNPEKYGFGIYDYCSSKKISRDYQVYYNGKVVQNLNRYYFSKGKPYLYKKKEGKSTFESVHKKEGIMLFNTFVEKPFSCGAFKDPSTNTYDINYQYYIKKAQDIIYGLEKSEIQLSLF